MNQPAPRRESLGYRMEFAVSRFRYRMGMGGSLSPDVIARIKEYDAKNPKK